MLIEHLYFNGVRLDVDFGIDITKTRVCKTLDYVLKMS